MKRLILWCALLLGSCAPRGEYVTFTGFQQGTTYSIIVRDPAPDTAARIDSVFREIDLTFSMFNPESLTSRINRGETDRVTPLFAECFRLARQIHRDSEGFYDPTVKPLIDAWGFGPGEMQRRPNLDSLMAFVGLDKIALVEVGEMGEVGGTGEVAETGGGEAGDGESDWQIVKSDPRVQLDFSSIAKGFTVDKMAEMLAQTAGDASPKALRDRFPGGLRKKTTDDERAGGASPKALRDRWPGGSRKKPSSCVARSAAGGWADFLVEIGGEIRVQGVNRQGVAWRVQIDRPEGGFAHQQAAVISLGGRNTESAEQGHRAESAGKDRSGRSAEQSRNFDGGSGGIGGVLTAVATSGNYRNWFTDEDGVTRVHTIDPHTSTPTAGQILSASVVSESCALSDGWATALIAAHDLATARRLLDNAAQHSDASQSPDDRLLDRAAQRSGAPQLAGTQPLADDARASALEWYIIAEDGVLSSPGFPIDPK